MAPFAVVGFLAVAVFAALLILSYAQLAVANDAMVTLRGQLSDLQAEHATLSAQYEKVSTWTSSRRRWAARWPGPTAIR